MRYYYRRGENSGRFWSPEGASAVKARINGREWEDRNTQREHKVNQEGGKTKREEMKSGLGRPVHDAGPFPLGRRPVVRHSSSSLSAPGRSGRRLPALMVQLSRDWARVGLLRQGSGDPLCVHAFAARRRVPQTNAPSAHAYRQRRTGEKRFQKAKAKRMDFKEIGKKKQWAN